jgi:FkbM family methyltransferase
MDVKSFLQTLKYRLGFHVYGFEIRSFNLPNDGKIEYAQWLHPFESNKEIQQNEIDELRRYLSEGDLAIDIGAHTGDTTIPMAIATGKKGLVLAFEPNKYVFRVLEKNSTLNREKTRIKPLMLAATEKDEETIFYYTDASFCNGGRYEGISKFKLWNMFRLKVSGRNIDKLLRDEYSDILHKLKFVKIDTEGYDHIVIRSIRALLSEYRPYIKAEVFMHSSFEQRLELFQTIRDLGYVIYKVASPSQYCGELLGINSLIQWKHYDIFCVPNKPS